MAVEVVSGIVLGSREYGERGMVVQLYTRELGRVGVMSYAGRGNDGAKLSPFLRVLSTVRVALRLGRHAEGMPKLVDVEEWERGAQRGRSCEKMVVGCFIGELIQRLLEERVPNEDFYLFLLERLGLFAAETQDEVVFLMVFLLDLAKSLGYAPQGEYTVSNRYFDVAHGAFCGRGEGEGADVIAGADAAVWGRLLDGHYLADLHDVDGSQRCRVLYQELRYLEVHSGLRLSLRSLEVLKELVG